MDFLDIVRDAVNLEASDIIVTAGEPPVYRVHGTLWCDQGQKALTDADTKALVYSLLRAEQIAKFEHEKELDCSLHIRDSRRFRINCFLQRGSVAAALRVIPDHIPHLKELGHPPELREIALALQGLLLVTGPTGSGKTTTLAAIVDEINRSRRAHIITIEDPIEYVHENRLSVIEQREVGDDTFSFGAALRRVLRQDPDVILVGEMRDLETISTAVTAAETGHLVLATLHTNDCVQTIDRMIDVFPSNQQYQIRSQLAASLLAIFNQRLVPRSDRVGQVAASELLVANTAARSMIREGKNHQIYSVIETGSREGMYTMDQSLRNLFLHGKIPLEEAKRRVRNPSMFDSLVRRAR